MAAVELASITATSAPSPSPSGILLMSMMRGDSFYHPMNRLSRPLQPSTTDDCQGRGTGSSFHDLPHSPTAVATDEHTPLPHQAYENWLSTALDEPEAPSASPKRISQAEKRDGNPLSRQQPSAFETRASECTLSGFDQPTPSSPRRHRLMPPSKRRGPPRNSTDALARWFAELACWIWFSPASSCLTGASLPGTPSRSPTASYAPLHSSPLANRRGVSFGCGHAEIRWQDAGGASVWTAQDRRSYAAPSAAPFDDLSNRRSYAAPFAAPFDDLSNRRSYAAPSAAPFDDLSNRLTSSVNHVDDPSNLRTAPRSRFVAFIRDTLRTTQVSTSVLMLALLYIRRLKLLHPKLRGQEGSEYRLCVTAMMLGNKFLDDHTYTNKTWSDISGIALKDVTRMEVEFWLGLQMRIHVTKDEYQEWQLVLENMYDQRAQVVARKEREASRRRAAAAAVSVNVPSVATMMSPFAPQPAVASQATGLRNSISYLPSSNAIPPPFAASTIYSDAVSPWSAANSDAAVASLISLSNHPSVDGQMASNSSPASQKSIPSTCATSISPGPDSRHVLGSMAGAEWITSSDGKFERDFTLHGRVAGVGDGHEPSFVSSAAWQQSFTQPQSNHFHPITTTTRLSNVGASGQLKRGRQESEDGSLLPQSKRLLAGPHDISSAEQNAASLAGRVGPVGLHASRRTPNSVRPLSGHGTISPQDSLYRSVFTQPLTPDCLMQAYAGPHGSIWSTQPDRQHLSFYQLAAGRDFGLPAFHLPPPPSYGPWVPTRSNSRRGSLGLSAYGISPRTNGEAGALSSMNCGVSSLPRTSSGLISSATSALASHHVSTPVRLSPEAYGLSYGSSSVALPACVGETFGPTEQSGNLEHPASNQIHDNAQNNDEKRLLPFNNVPMDMQLHHLQQWQQMHYFPHMQQPTLRRNSNASRDAAVGSPCTSASWLNRSMPPGDSASLM